MDVATTSVVLSPIGIVIGCVYAVLIASILWWMLHTRIDKQRRHSRAQDRGPLQRQDKHCCVKDAASWPGIVQYARDHQYDVILMGHQLSSPSGTTAFTRSVEYVLQHAPSEVIIDRPCTGLALNSKNNPFFFKAQLCSGGSVRTFLQ
jgi:nucleotide-binding universal stress UspA family protein